MARLGQMLADRGDTHQAQRWLRQAANLGRYEAKAGLDGLPPR